MPNPLFPNGERPLQESDSFRIPGLDQSFESIAQHGARALYDGDLSAAFTKEVLDNGGFVTRDDLAAYHAVVREPIGLRSRGFDLALNPPPAVGGTAVGCLINAVQSNWRDSMNAAERAQLHARSQLLLLGIREEQLDHPGLGFRAARALLMKTGSLKNLPALKSPNTTHLSVVTADGSMVSVTMSMGYGSGVTIPSLGICCNNSLGEPELNPQGFHAARPGTRLVSSMAPTLAWHADGRCVAFGSPGASRITTSIAQTWARLTFEGMTFEEAAQAPRLHIEPFHDGLRAQYEPGIDASLLKDEFMCRPFDSQEAYFGAIKLAGLDSSGQLHAIADERRHGAVEFVEE